MANQDTTPLVNDQTTEYVQLEQYQDTTSIDKILKKLGIWFKPRSVTFVGKIPETEDERPQILDISYVLFGILISEQVAEAYRKGFIDGGIEQLNKGGE